MEFKQNTYDSFGESQKPINSVIADYVVSEDKEDSVTGTNTFNLLFDIRQMQLIVSVGDLNLTGKSIDSDPKFAMVNPRGEVGTISFNTKEEISCFMLGLETALSNIRQIVNSYKG